MAFPYARAALAVLLLSSFVFALTAEDVARFYLKSGETMKLDTVTVSGTTYDIVKIDGTPSLVLAPSGSTFAPLSDQTRLASVIQAYSQQVYSAKNFQNSVALLNQTTPVVQQIVGDCVIGAQQFMTVIPTRTIRIGSTNIGLYYLIRSSQTYSMEQNAIASINQTLPGFNASYGAYLSNAAAFASLVASNNADDVLSAAQSLHQSAVTLQGAYGNMTTAYAQLDASHDFSKILEFTFYIQGQPHNCSLDGNATTALTRVANEFSDQSLQSSAQLTDSVLAFSASRGSSASKDTAYALRQEDAVTAASAVANLSAQFNAAGYKVDLKVLAAKKDALNAGLASVKSTGKADAFDALMNDFNAQLARYHSAYAPFKSAAVSVKAASDGVSAAAKKYGEADTRITAMASELNALRTNFSASISLLSSGDAAKASTQFIAESAQGNDLAQRSATLPAQGNQLDLPVIIGIVVLVLLLAGTLWYFRKMKKSNPKMGS